MAFESTLTGDSGPQAALGHCWLVARAAVVVAIAATLGLYIPTQYSEHVGKALTKVMPGNSLTILAVAVATALPASVVMPFFAMLVELLLGGLGTLIAAQAGDRQPPQPA